MTRPIRALLLIPVLAGCYAYRPIGSRGTTGGDHIRLTLTDSGAVTLAPRLGPATEEVSGHVMGDSAGAYVVSVRGTRRRGGAETEWKGEYVAIPRVLVARAEERRFSRSRTIVASLGVAIAVIAARQAFWGPGGVSGGAPPGGGPTPR